MASETMTRAERVAAALAFEKPDRVPVVPQVVKSTTLTFAGVSQGEGSRNTELAHKCMLKTFDDFGGWDALYLDCPDSLEMQLFIWKQPLEFKVPGVDLPDDALLQAFEREAMTIEDYDRVAEEGWEKFYVDELVYRISRFPRGSAPDVIKQMEEFYVNRCLPDWDSRGVKAINGGADSHPFFKLSLARSLVKFTEDLYYKPALVEKVMQRMTEETIATLTAQVNQSGIKCVLLGEERASAFYYPLRIFEKFWWPYTVQIVNAMWSQGIVTEMHLDTDFSKNLPYFKRDLPKGSYMLQLDSMTNIFAAKEFLRGHAMFHGDLPPSLQVLGSAEDVANYCKKLIDEVGYEGGYILGVGCETTPNFKRENFRAMIETGKTYELSKK